MMRAAVVLFVLTVPALAGAACPDTMDPGEVVRHWKQTGDESCLRAVISKRPVISARVARDLVNVPGGFQAALAAADANSAAARGFRFEAAKRFLDGAAPTDPGRASAKAALARNVDESGDAVGSAALLARALATGGENPSGLCKSLVDKKRPAQALACLDGGGKAVDDEARIGVLQAQTSLTAETIATLAKDSPLEAAVRACTVWPEVIWDGSRPTIRGFNVPKRSSRVFSLLADNAEEPSASCFVVLSAFGCVDDIMSGLQCDALDSMARYANLCFRVGRTADARQFLISVFAMKNGFYSRLESSANARPALLQLHLALAHVYKRVGGADPIGHDWRWHLDQAHRFWTQLHGDVPFPKELVPQ
jgi:hypothetical protein